ncbi:hypothetical protein A2715_05365 [Candidatus Woesebacteria bacterium RIFCSPHIGHO2_01_FULL_39_32]|uniref:MurNAc-LAA domain-containing protein n=1 Tax=Candidatus Woesebacteria bacterium RIFCSPLOWO2_01_FULL_39_25 TaxID=1802521 RepID=A0A1F8BMT8_9BACT|nr:MAG: hypothetical protein A2715_05365 [Candidatus Woesebacteria bacterium RIFCSPHIGHO2_01_FULL_39_32]OGM38551.1 MAG: hypothetical protein A3F01_04320 [Candidatus Woesebacteria bacterium RIFCSPHIGHO2_12_FULL_38_11]OGM64979.1 MAG: hypothetical protein A2893_04975 [Candidatus Woesebacteria bacterium RIFCSPLOWO2_01_FULL_39_25]
MKVMRKISFLLSLLFILLSTSIVFAKPPNPGGGNEDFVPILYSVCIDPGHGGSEVGSVNGSLKESTVNLEVANLLKNKLMNYGYNPGLIFMTRTDDSDKSNADRYNFCNSQKTAVLISIHHNGSSDSSVDYTSALYFKGEDKEIANYVTQNISQKLVLPNNGIRRYASGVLLKSKMPATISEGFFLTSSDEYNLIKNSDRLDQEAEALFSAINTFFGK